MDRPPVRLEDTPWRISYVGHASFLIQTAGLSILLDPVWSTRASPSRFVGPKRVNDPGIAFADLPPIDVVLESHGHYDHLDVRTLSRVAAAHRARVITPLGNDVIMPKFDPAIAAEAYDWDDRIDIGSGIEVTLVAARHWSARNLSTGTISAVHESVTGRLNWLFSPLVLSSRVMRDNHMNPAEAVASFDRTCQSVAEFAAMRNACIGPNKKRVAAVVSR